jgi:superoxide dismutase, Fe-Mn family
VAFELPPLPWADDALEPYMSANTLSFHYGKHHRTYVDTLNKLTAGSDLETKSLEEVIGAVAGDPAKQAIFNNAAQVWNHTFFWNSIKPGGGGAPSGALADRIGAAFGGYDAFAEQFKAGGVGRFGSGWVWLVDEGGQLKVVSTPNAEMPVPPGQKALLVCDVWEHAYYLDFQNRRPDFLQSFLDNLVNWDFVARNLG